MKFIVLVVLLLSLVYVNSEIEVNNENAEDYGDFDEDGIVSIENSVVTIKEEDNEKSNEKDVDENDIDDYQSPTIDLQKFYFAEHFDDQNIFNKNWIKSEAKKPDVAEEIAKYDGEWNVEKPKKHVWNNDLGLVLKSQAKHAAIASKLFKPFVFDEKPLVVQYEVTLQDGQTCGGSYLKLLSEGKEIDDLTKFNDKTPYTIMFGPDKCGNDIKLHFIFRHVNPINGSITEKHCRKPRERLEEPFKDKLPHLYQLVLRPDNTFEIRVDHKIVNQGSLLNDFEPPINPPKEIEDPNDKKPEDWDEREKIPDSTAQKPDDWDENEPPQIPDPNAVKPADWLEDEPEMISDPNAKKPDDWDTDMDGEWEPPLIENPVCENAVGCGQWKAPLIPNPNYKGKWRAPLIDNPNYQGKWIPKKIPNPDFFEDLQPFKMTTISAVGIEIWSMSGDILFDNIIITDNIEAADEWAEKTFDLKRKQIDKDSKTFWQRALRHMGYKPKWWAIYFIWVSIPIGLYIRFLKKTAQEDTFFGKLVKLTYENPILWGLYILIIGVPLVFIFCVVFGKKKDEVERKEREAKSKKTDEPTPDDTDQISDTKVADVEQNEISETKHEDNEIKTETSPNENNSNENDESEKKLKEPEQNIEENSINNVIENIGDVEETNSQQTESGARKRKSRKE